MPSIYAITFLLLVFAVSEVIAQKTKAIISTTLAVATILIVSFWVGLPKDIFKNSAVSAMGIILVGLLITAMGTMMDFKELKRQWTTVIISLVCVFAGVGLILLLGGILIGREMSIAGAPIFAGANTATLIMNAALADKGLEALSIFCVLMLVTQNFIGIPIASLLLKKEASLFLARPENIELYRNIDTQTEHIKSSRMIQLPEGFDKPSAMLTKLAIVASISFFISGLTQGAVHYFIVALLLGVIFSELGFLEKNILTKTDLTGFIVFATTMVVFANLADTTPALLLSMLVPLMICLTIGVIGVCIAGIIMGKVLHISPYLSIALGLTCTFGFPTTMLMPKEIAAAMGKTPAESEAITNYMMPKLITAGFVTVTIASVVIAGIVVKLL